jgi:isocitrate/isopropylmalate dehydrogenase
MTSFNIVVFAGDHCGPEVMAEGIKILKTIESAKPDIKFNFQEHLLGGCSINATGYPLTDEALQAAKSADAILLGAIGGPVSLKSLFNISLIPKGMGHRCCPSRARYPKATERA